MAKQRSWEQVKRDRPVDPVLVATYRALLEAERALGPLLDERTADKPVTDGGPAAAGAPTEDALAAGPRMEDALAAAEAAAAAGEPGLGLYLETLRRHLEALGGHLELRAVLPEGEVNLPCWLGERSG
jgi:hypothetical protein